MFLSRQSGLSLKDFDQTTPPLVIENFFQGRVQGQGLIQDFRGKVIQRFTLDMEGQWEGGRGLINEHFNYADGTTQHRRWQIQRVKEGLYKGDAEDFLETARGESQGCAMRWRYRMILPVAGRTIRASFDDWMFRVSETSIVNRSYIRKWGLTLAELTLILQKETP